MSDNNETSHTTKRNSNKSASKYFFMKKNFYESPNPTINCDPNIDNKSTFLERDADHCPYKGWKYYFPDEDYTIVSETVKHVSAILEYVDTNRQAIIDSRLEENKFYCFDFTVLCQNDGIKAKWPQFKEDLVEKPDHTLGCLGFGLYQLLVSENNCNVGTIVRARLNRIDNIIPIKNLKAGLYGKLVGVRGTVIRVGAIHLRSSFLTFQCNTCKCLQSTTQRDGVYRPPTSCPQDGCRSRSFIPVVSSKYTRTRSCQIVRLQENIDDDRDGGRVPRTVECELTDDLVDTCGPGDNVTVIGIVKVQNTDEGSKKSKSANLFSLFLEGVSVLNSKGRVSSGRNQLSGGVEFSLKDYYAIQEIHNEKNCWRLLVNSVCPSVYGHEMVKAGMLLSLIGGASSSGPTATRGDPHVLVVGDPGLGKSHMLHAAASIAPRGVYVCGNTASSSGLTVTLTKESGGDYALEAGALVLADRGTCCIDEFDKMTSQHQALLEAMEQQCISIAKGGVVCTLPARTAIIAAANPAGGHYNKNKTVAENLKMGQPLLSRFDLVFILLDKPNEQLDSLLSEHVMALHSGKPKSRLQSVWNLTTSSEAENATSKESLSERLKIKGGEAVDLVPAVLLRKYIAYARKYVSSLKLSMAAAAVLQDFYLELRRLHQKRQWTPVTTRQLESMIRLTQARAKVELREEATEEDARDVVELMRWSMVDTYSDENGTLNFSRSQNGSGMSGGSKVKRFISGLQMRAQLEGKSTFSIKEMKDLCSAMSLQLPDFFGFISNLNTQGFLLKKGPNTYQLLSA